MRIAIIGAGSVGATCRTSAKNNNGAHSLLALGLKMERVRRVCAVPRPTRGGSPTSRRKSLAAAGGGAQGATQGRPRSTTACEGRRAAAFASTYDMTPIRLTDSQLQEVLQAARMVPFDLGQAFLEQLAIELHGKDLGDGVVHRVAYSVARAITWNAERTG